MTKKKMRTMILSALFLACGMVLPFFTAQVKEIGDTFLPMHIPVLLCGFICGPIWGFAVGFCLPFLRSVVFSMPALYPNAVWMALELATYGCSAGIFYSRFQKIYPALILSMILGRIVWGISKTILLGLGGSAFSVQAFLIGGFLDAFPGILLQLFLIPLILKIIHKKSDT